MGYCLHVEARGTVAQYPAEVENSPWNDERYRTFAHKGSTTGTSRHQKVRSLIQSSGLLFKNVFTGMCHSFHGEEDLLPELLGRGGCLVWGGGGVWFALSDPLPRRYASYCIFVSRNLEMYVYNFFLAVQMCFSPKILLLELVTLDWRV